MTHGATTSRSRPHVVLGVSGGIAAYKACELLRRLTESGHDVTVVPTASALAFVGAPTWAALSGRPVADRRVDRRPRGAARPDRAGRRPGRGRPGDGRPAGQGRARPRRRPAHQHAADRALPGRVRPRDAHRDVGAPRDAGQRGHAPRARRRTWSSPPRAGSPAPTRARAGCRTRRRSSPWSSRPARPSYGEHAATWPAAGSWCRAGGTREYLDPVRFLGNRSSGRQGFALARTAAARGAEVTLVAANVGPRRPGRGQGGPRRDHRGAAARGGRCVRPAPTRS